jgi:hypothetical protein
MPAPVTVLPVDWWGSGSSVAAGWVTLDTWCMGPILGDHPQVQGGCTFFNTCRSLAASLQYASLHAGWSVRPLSQYPMLLGCYTPGTAPCGGVAPPTGLRSGGRRGVSPAAPGAAVL